MMTAYYLLPPPVLTLYGIISICVTIAAAFTLVNACVLRLRGRSIAAAAISAAAAVFMLQIFSDIGVQLEYNESPAGWVRAAGNMPAAAATVLLIIIAAVEAALIRDIIVKINSMPTGNSIKESLDDLPDGICFSTKDGQPLLINTKMNDISARLFGSVIMNVKDCERKLRERSFLQGVRIISHESASTVLADEGSVWDIHIRDLDIARGEVTETLAFDVTEQYKLSRELEKNNRVLSGVNRDLKRYSGAVDKLAREEEILAAKTKVHDDVGRSLLSFRAYLVQPEDTRNRSDLLALWRHDINVMKHEADPGPARDGLELLMEAADAVGVTIDITGELPEEERLRRVIITAIHECLTNTVRHAHGKEVDVEIDRGDGTVIVKIMNDGRRPDGIIEETGGLKNLRAAAEREGGAMQITSLPEFILWISLPMEEK